MAEDGKRKRMTKPIAAALVQAQKLEVQRIIMMRQQDGLTSHINRRILVQIMYLCLFRPFPTYRRGRPVLWQVIE